jgi:hypothetical protein
MISVQRGFFRRPKIYFQDVPPRVIQELSTIAIAHHATVVASAQEASHLVMWEEEVDSHPPEYFEKEEYIRAIEVRPHEAGVGRAYVHWWYLPDSYDEWIPLSDVEHNDPPDAYILDDPLKKWRVNCKFIRDVQVFHEWGNELDYSLDRDAEDDGTAGPSSPRRVRTNKRKLAVRKENGIIGAVFGTEQMNQDLLPPTEDPTNGPVHVVEVSPNLSGNDYVSKNIIVTRKLAAPRETIPDDFLLKRRKMTTKNAKPSLPDWFSPNVLHSIEAQFLNEFFSGHPTRTPALYMRIRNMIHGLYQQDTSSYLSATDVRKKVAGDVCITIRIHEFLDAFGVINYSVRADLRPSYAPFVPVNNAAFSFIRGDTLKDGARGGSNFNNKIVGFGDIQPSKRVWTTEMDKTLLSAAASCDGNWDAVSSKMLSIDPANSVTPHECMLRFIALPLSSSEKHSVDDVQHGIALISEDIPSRLTSLAAVFLREAAEQVSPQSAKDISELVAKV